jgi:hypothetical protein
MTQGIVIVSAVQPIAVVIVAGLRLQQHDAVLSYEMLLPAPGKTSTKTSSQEVVCVSV